MANPLIKSFDDEILDVKKQSLYARLKRLFSTDVIVRNVGGKQLKIKDTDNIMYATDRNSLRDRFNRIRSTAYNAYTRDFALSYQAARMDLFRDYDCVGPDTIIPLPDGTNPTIAELAEKYKDKPQERFWVFSYDHKTDTIKLGKAFHPRKKGGGTREGFKVTFDNGRYVIGSIKHPFLMRNGEYKRILELNVGDSVMPFYQYEYGYKKNGVKPYRKVYNFSNGYQSIHKIVAEQFYRPIEKNEVVHHKNFKGYDNSPENLQIMDHKKHDEFHSNHSKNVIWGKENYENQLNKLKSHPNYINREFHHWNGERIGENNPFFGKNHSDESNEKRSETLKEVFINRDQTGDKNPKYRDDLTIEVLKVRAIEHYKENGKLTSWGFVNDIGCDYSVLQNRLKKNNTDWKAFKNEVETSLNHKIVSIEHIGPLEVYDVTVEEFHNFACDSCILKNTMDMDPIISCVFADTYISTLEGFVTIKDLAAKYSSGKCFKVWSWDKDEHKLTLGNAHHPRKTGTKNIIEVHLDNGEVLKCTPDHRIMLIDGTYKKAGQLSEGESLMPFYHRINKYYGYQEIKSLGSRFKYTHRYIFENIFEDTDLDGYNIHHKNHNKLDNRIENLEKITAIDHCRLHGIHPITTGKRVESCKRLWTNPEYRKQCSFAIKQWQNSDEGKRMMSEHTSIMDKNRWKNDPEYVSKMTQIFSDHAKSLWNDPSWKEWKRKKHSETMKLKYANDPTLKEKTKRCGNKNGKYSNEVTTESVLVEGIKYGSLVELARVFDFKGLTFKNDQYRCQFLSRRIKEAGYKGWSDYKNKFEYSNHKVTKIIDNNEITDVYDLTVDFYENFAVKQGMILSNSALDIYADECLTYNEMGKMLTVHSNNHNVKQILDNLFTDILNIQFNLWSWVRNMTKYGDFYLKLYITPEYGVYMVEPISAYNVERIENADPFNKRYVKFQIRPTDTAQAEVLENYEVAHFRMITDSNFLPYGKCLAANSYVNTEFGSKRITDVTIGENIWTFNKSVGQFELSPIIAKQSTGIKKTIKISTQHNQIECSGTHPIMVWSQDNFQLEYKEARNISVGDVVAISSNKYNKSRSLLLKKTLLTEDNHNGWKNNLLNLPSEPDSKFARFFGFMIGDGWLNQTLDRVSFAAGIDAELNEKYSNCLAEYSGKEVKIIPQEEKSGEKRYVNSKLLAEFLYINGFVGNATTKRIPPWIYELDRWSKLEFIRGLVDADGSIFTDKWNVNRYSVELNNKELVEDVKELLRGLDIKCSNVKSRRPEGKTEICGIECHRNTSYYIYFYLDGLEKIQLEKYNFSHNENIILDPIISISIENEQEMYDIQVESENSNFVANGIVVHNCMIEGARRVWKQLSLMEDAMLISRIMRAPERRIFYTDIGNIPPSEVDAYMEKMIGKMKKVPYMDEQTGEYNLRFNLQNMVEDYYIPVRGGDSGTKIDTLPGMEWTGIEDLEYLKNKMMAALKIPKAFLGYDDSISGKATLACVVPETQVPLFNGLTKTVKELIEDHNNGIKNYVYSIDEATKNIVAGEIEWAGFTRMNTDVVRVYLDNTQYIDCTPDHRFMTRDGNWVEAKDLVEGQSLMPLYEKGNGVTKIELLSERRDTCDITIKKYHNFATSAGVIIHNSEDVRFARTIQRIQRIITSELTKIAIVHLYAQGYRDESLVDFELELTNPSTIFEKEKIEIWSDKVAVATDMTENKFFSYDWVYKNIFNMSEDDIKKVKDEVVEDTKQKFRLTSIEEEGDDPAKPFKKIGGKGGGGGGDKGGMGDLGGGSHGGGGGGGKLDLGDEKEDGEGDKEGGPDLGGLDDLVKETKERDQTGEHHTADDGEFGPDPLGDQELHRKPNKNSEGRRASPLQQNPEKASPLRLKEHASASKRTVDIPSKKVVDSALISSLSGFMAKSQFDIKKELIRESEGTSSKSMLDESNIKD